MRKVIIPDKATPPTSWLKAAKLVTDKLEAAANEDERKAIIEKHQNLWRDDRVRDWLLSVYHNKCWYTEAQESVSAIHVDHYRPKGRVTDLDNDSAEGYWWLAFNWTNYRICGQLINVKKSDVFPLSEPPRATHQDPKSLGKEAPILIDPTTDDARLISYEMDEDACIAVPSGEADVDEEKRASATISILGLNRLDRLNQKRADVWKRCGDTITDYVSAANDPQCMKALRQAIAVQALGKMTAYEQEFSSVAQACIWKNAPAPLRAKVAG